VVLTTTGTTTPFGYAGQYTDPATGLQYLRARYYDPATQQFLTVDPLLAQTEQAYAYAGGSPTNGSDPSGRFAWIIAGAAIGAVANMGYTWFANDRHPTFDQLLAAGVSGAIAGAVGAAAGPLAAEAAVGLIGDVGGVSVLAGGLNGIISAVGGAVGQGVANLLDPCHPGDIVSSAVYSGVGGVVGALIPVAKMGSWKQALEYKPERSVGYLTNVEQSNLGKIVGSFFVSSGLGLAANVPSWAPSNWHW